jgi:hypothetical protein
MPEFTELTENIVADAAPQVETSATEATTGISFADMTLTYADTYSFIRGVHSNTSGMLQNISTLFDFDVYTTLKEYDISGESGEGEYTYETQEPRYEIELSASEMTIVKSYLYNSAEGGAEVTLYRNYGVDEPSVSMFKGQPLWSMQQAGLTAYSTAMTHLGMIGIEEEATVDVEEMADEMAAVTYYGLSYYDNEDAGLRTKFGSKGTGSMSFMRSMFSASVTAIYNTNNATRSNFKKIRSPIVEPYNISFLSPLYSTGSMGESSSTGTTSTTSTQGGY